MTIQDKCFMFAARSHMLQMKCNFKNGMSDLKCRKCGVQDEEQKHIFECPALDDNYVSPHSNLPVYETLFSDDPQKIMTIGNILRSRLNLLTNNITNPRAHYSQLAAVTSSAATDSNINDICVLQSVELD